MVTVLGDRVSVWDSAAAFGLTVKPTAKGWVVTKLGRVVTRVMSKADAVSALRQLVAGRSN